MGFFKRFGAAVKSEDSVVLTAKELDDMEQDIKKRKKRGDDEHTTSGTGTGKHPSDPS